MNTLFTLGSIACGIILLFLLVFLLVRLCSSAFYRSKREFLEWYYKQPNYRGD